MRFARTRSERLLGIFLIALIVIPLGYIFVYIPAKFGYVISRIESAKTASEEFAALKLATGWAKFWEIYARDPNTGRSAYNQSSAKSMVENPAVSIELEIEFFASDPYGKGPYRARRSLIDKRSLYLFFGEPP